MRMVDIDDFIEDQLSVIDASVVNLLQGWGYTEGERMDDAERALIEAADSYIGELESGGPYGKLEKLFGQALTAWRAEQ